MEGVSSRILAAADPGSSLLARNVKLGEGAVATSASGNGGDDVHLLTHSSRLDLEPYSAVRYQLSSAELAGVIVAAALVTAALIGVAIWLHVRRKRSKSQVLAGESGAARPPLAPQVSVISMDSTGVKPIAIRQNSMGNGSLPYYNSYQQQRPGYYNDDMHDEELGSITEYGSVMGSFPPSPAGSFRSAIDAPGFSRSRSGTGTSFGTVASFGSYRSRVSNTASFHTCVEEEFS